ncbi:MAG: hypothetical protein RLY86_3936 [Pseudomonadota bacterium]|jgi:hypothetical protein
MNWFAITLGTMIVLLSLKPSVARARKLVLDTKVGLIELRRRRAALSQRLRALARESLGQRLTAGADNTESQEMNDRVALMTKRIEELEAVDRRVLVFDERRGLAEQGWILLIRRPRNAAPALEPPGVTRLWDEGRLVFVFASDARKARRKAQVRFPEEGGFEFVEVYAHEADLTEPPAINNAVATR